MKNRNPEGLRTQRAVHVSVIAILVFMIAEVAVAQNPSPNNSNAGTAPREAAPETSEPPPRQQHWEGGLKPPGWTADAYSPDGDGTPQFGEHYEDPDPDEPYDAREDPYHPLRDPTQDPGKEWEGQHGENLNTISVAGGDEDWPFGERYYGASFGAPLEINNHCLTAQTVAIFVNNISYLTLPKTVLAPPGKMIVMGQVQLPDEPNPLHEGEGHVDFGDIIIPPGMMPPPKLHQPDFLEIDGTVVVWHAWAPPDCNAARHTYSVGGHIHFNPPPPDDGGPSSLATTNVCTLYWNLGVPPDQLGGQDCTQEMRELAKAFVERILAPYVQNAPEQWMWLPGAGAIGSMSISEMLAMKARAEGLMGHRDASPPATPTSAAARPHSTAQNGMRTSNPSTGGSLDNASFGVGNEGQVRALESRTAAPDNAPPSDGSIRFDATDRAATPPRDPGQSQIRRTGGGGAPQTSTPTIARPEDNAPRRTTSGITGVQPEEPAPAREESTP